jgi:hypothetical protein
LGEARGPVMLFRAAGSPPPFALHERVGRSGERG